MKEKKSTATTASTGLWQQFYEVAAQFRDMAPWRWMADGDMFGVTHPSHDEIGWCSIMGRAGEHFALAVYKGTPGLVSFNALADSDYMTGETNPEKRNIAYGQRCWMIAFEDANLVYPESKKHLKSLGISFRGKGQWIVATTNEPGYHPWPIEETDLPFLIQCLQQAMNVAIRFEDNTPLLYQNEEEMLIRAFVNDQWEDQYIDPDTLPDDNVFTPVVPSAHFKQKLAKLPKAEGAIILASFIMEAAIQDEPNTRPWNPLMLLGVQYGSGYILHQSMIRYDELDREIEKFLLAVFSGMKCYTTQLVVHHIPVYELLEEFCEEAGIHLILMETDNPVLNELGEMMQMFNQFR